MSANSRPSNQFLDASQVPSIAPRPVTIPLGTVPAGIPRYGATTPNKTKEPSPKPAAALNAVRNGTGPHPTAFKAGPLLPSRKAKPSIYLSPKCQAFFCVRYVHVPLGTQEYALGSN